MAIDGHRSTFVGGGSIDQFTEMVDLSPNEKVAAQRWQTLKLQESLTSAEQIEFNNLTTQLSNKIFSAEKFNTLADCIVALEIFFRDNVEGYIETKQQEFDATLQKFSDKGTYNNTFNYMQWNTILYNYEGYISRKDNNLNHTPIGDETDIWWQKIAQRGRQGQAGLGLRFTGLFSISKTYSENDAVAYYGDDGYAIYYCLSSCMGVEPTDENYWAIFMSIAQMSSIIGNMDELETENKSSIVNAINEVVTLALSKANEEHNHVVEDITNFPELANVALSGDYEDLNNTPTIPTVINNLTSEDTTEALSAAQGKILKDEITSHKAEIAVLTPKSGSTANDILLNIALTDKKKGSFKASVNNTGNMTINGKAFKKDTSTQIPAGYIKAGKVYDFYYDATADCVFILAKASGNAQPSDVLAGRTFSNDDGEQIGTKDLSGLVPEVLLEGVTIDGVAGTLKARKFATGKATPNASYNLIVSGLNFKPTCILAVLSTGGIAVADYAESIDALGSRYSLQSYAYMPFSTSGGYVNETGFKLPAGIILEYNWVAYA